MSKPFLIMQLRPEDEAADDEFRAILQYGGLAKRDTVRARVERAGLPDIDLTDYAAIIVGGSPFDISTPEPSKSAIQKRIEREFMALFARIVAVDFPFFGACSGSGLLGKFCGARISSRYAEPVGGADVELTSEGARDPLLSGFPPTFRVLLGHKEACETLPSGAVLLVTSPACPVQMFRLEQNIYATQFHPEADLEGFAVRINVYKNHGYFAPETAQALVDALAGERTPHAQAILARFVRRFGASTSEREP